jgi:transglutaminase-like putative cysteine protease
MSSSDQPEPPDLIERTEGLPESGAVRYRVRHATAYEYGDEILLAHHLLHLEPRPVSHQRIVSFRMDIAPLPSVRTDHLDHFGNPATYLEMREPHGRLTVLTEMEVEVAEPFATSAASISWEAVRDLLGCPSDEHARDADGYRHASSLVPTSDELREYALPSFPDGRAIGEAALDLTRRIHAEFTFDPEATTVSTPVAEVLRDRRGVCQDFAHLQIGCLRSLGLAGRYVSGYLRTIPPPGRARLVGADVSHAWLSLWCGGDSWLDLDPTNGRSGSTDMIALAWGRDYDDVSPMRGVILGGSHQHLSVQVDVE